MRYLGHFQGVVLIARALVTMMNTYIAMQNVLNEFEGRVTAFWY